MTEDDVRSDAIRKRLFKDSGYEAEVGGLTHEIASLNIEDVRSFLKSLSTYFLIASSVHSFGFHSSSFSEIFLLFDCLSVVCTETCLRATFSNVVQIRDFHSRFYRPDVMSIVVLGDLTLESLLEELQRVDFQSCWDRIRPCRPVAWSEPLAPFSKSSLCVAPFPSNGNVIFDFFPPFSLEFSSV